MRHQRFRTVSGSGSSPEASDNARGPGAAGWDRLTLPLCPQPGERAETSAGHAEKRRASPAAEPCHHAAGADPWSPCVCKEQVEIRKKDAKLC